jgi:hypothetical protein
MKKGNNEHNKFLNSLFGPRRPPVLPKTKSGSQFRKKKKNYKRPTEGRWGTSS